MDMIQTIQLFYQKTDILQNQQLNIIIKLIFHNGVREALNQTRLKFWVKKPRNYISRNIKKCIICNHHEGNPFQYPAPPYLPLYRLNDKFPFTYRAVDYAGPLCINNIYGKLQTFKCQTRLKFWVKKPRNYISRNIKKCIICNHHEGNPFQYPAPPYLPLYRLNDKFPFTYRAVDYAGPLCINNIYSKLQTFKCQIVLFTCASNRCVYIDLVPDCCSSSQICVLKKFFLQVEVYQR